MSATTQETLAAIQRARKDLKSAYAAMHTARSGLEDMGSAHAGAQSDSGALWTLAWQVDEMRRILNRIAKDMERA